MSDEHDELAQQLTEQQGVRWVLLGPHIKEKLGDGPVTNETVAAAITELRKEPDYWPAFKDPKPIEYSDLRGLEEKTRYIEAHGLDSFMQLLRRHYAR